MDIFANLYYGLSIAATPDNLMFCFIGVLLGTLIGVLPGLGPTATVAMLLPITFFLPPTGAIIILAGIFYGAQYGGSTTAILVKLPGESSSVVTCLDGYEMAKQGRAGAALAIAALGSLFAGCVTALVIAIAGPPLAEIAILFGPAEYVALLTVGLIGAVVLASGSLPKAIAMVLLGLLIGCIGTDLTSGEKRMTFDMTVLYDGIGFVPLAMGMFGLVEVIFSLEETGGKGRATLPITRLWPTRKDFKEAWPAATRGTFLGVLLGVLPGSGATLASFASYALEKKVSKEPEKFGTGAVQGLAGPESANNAAAQACFIPMLSLGVPPNAIMALMIGALMIQGIQPGPSMIASQPDLFWGIVASMLIGNIMLVLLNLPLIGLWVKLLRVPYSLLFPIILVFCAIGTYSLNNSVFEVGLMAMFGVVGYGLRKLGCEMAPLMLGFVVGPMLEENIRRTMLTSAGDPSVFVTRPIAATMFAVAALLLVSMLLPAFTKRREKLTE
ncbi:tripartite tricarboxylate transporter permease [Agrobacterium rubi]|uniref:tripartite tricarboxylate transporter permease n=1 Tax=Agrobacterium rubi TaxID=28099 RepID=UPI001571C4AB|nr:tripartite tricarboxylate transporter permease [Agrobacterium rubi]NTF08920.1 tripartite tricarboxylate transporter permease [Agrobacterium rubi]NTF21191.1 tripartite tricarboxylate transporter permease [Agrobacterium rubi]NTF28048.1 tripartite tricarboxylate transporter permease [Agrobacterium rubi]